MENAISVGERIRELRKARGLTLKDVAQRTGYSYQAIAAYEKGERRVGVEQAMRLAQALQCSLRDILGEDGSGGFAMAQGIDLFELPRQVKEANCVPIRDPLAYARAGGPASSGPREQSAQSLEDARYMEYLASSYEAVLALLDGCLGEGAGLVALRMLSSYARLNADGRLRCLEDMEDLTELSRFKKV